MAGTSMRAEAYPAGVILTARVAPSFTAAGPTVAAEDDEADAGFEDGLPPRTASPEPARVTLRDHSAGVERWVESFTGGLGVDGGLAAALARAAALHDLGKADWRFQYLLYGDEPDETPLAKSGRDYTPAQQAKLRRRAGLPDGFRHEFVSAALVRRNRDATLAGLTADGGELVEYLVGVHHGRGRPFIPYVREGDPGGRETVRAEWEGRRLEAGADHGLWRLDEGWAELFWRLVGRYGPWGLAYLEALLRLADGARSAEERQTEGAA
jgi:CRISPR-associated endonuclease/helicase Cas3